MNEKPINIIHWDDNPDFEGFTEVNIKYALSEFNVDIGINKFCTSPDEFLELMRLQQYDLIILDIEGGPDKPNTGFELLNEVIAKYKNRIPFLIFSRYAHVLEKIKEFKQRHNLKIEFLNKYKRGEPDYGDLVKEALRGLIDFKSLNVSITADLDFNTQSAIRIIGIDNIGKILSIYKSVMPFIVGKEAEIRAISPGYSGAFVFQVKFGNLTRLLKISHSLEIIQTEFQNLERYSIYLPSSIKVDFERISPSMLSSDGWYSIIYEFVEYSSTFFDFVINCNNSQIIEEILEELFSTRRLRKLYENEMQTLLPLNKNIFEDLNSTRAAYVKNSIDSLQPILANYMDLFDYDLIYHLIENQAFQNISESNIKISKSSKVLAHADLHANNILVNPENQPIVIDFGSVNYKHWSCDICRLIVDLFIRGTGYNTVSYFDINGIELEYQIAKSIVEKTSIVASPLTGIQYALNWLMNNINKIHSKSFNVFEYQLGLAMEFLKASYRSSSLPPNKRVLALLSAVYAIKKANEAKIKSG